MARILVTDCPPGPALDAAVAKVLGWTVVPLEMKDTEDLGYPRVYWFRHEDKEWLDYAHDEEDASVHCWSPSSDIAAAWELIETMGIKHSPSLYQIAKWHCNFLVEQKVPQGYAMLKPLEANGLTAPLAITRAFLLAHGVTEVEVPDD